MVHYKVCLRICGEALNTGEITRELGIEPTKVVEVGDKGPLGPAQIPVRMWQTRTEDGSENWSELEAGLRQIINVYGRRKQALAKLQQRWEVLLFCGYFTDELGGPTLSPDVLKGLGDLGVELFLDTYLFTPQGQTERGG